MARNEEKARSAMNVFLRRHEIGRVVEKRPVHTAFVKSVEECQKWMGQVIREIVEEVSLIQNSSLGEAKIREKNDLINKLMRERKFWERRIIELGGVDLAEKLGIDVREERRARESATSSQLKEDLAILSGEGGKKRGRGQQYGEGEGGGRGGGGGADGPGKDGKFKGQISTSTRTLGISGDFDTKDVIGVDGYYYFGAARDLPGVKELYQKSQSQDVFKVKKRDLKQRADASYFGFLEDFDQRLLREEAEMEDQILAQLLAKEQTGNSIMARDVATLFDETKVEVDLEPWDAVNDEEGDTAVVTDADDGKGKGNDNGDDGDDGHANQDKVQD